MAAIQVKQFTNSKTVGATVTVKLPLGKDGAIGSYNIHYLDEGMGEALLLIHGAGQSLYTWHSCIGYLAGRFRVIAVDLLGFGYSSSTQFGTFSCAEQALVLSAFLKEMKIDRAYVAGFGSGAIIAAALAAKDPARVSKLVLMSPGVVTASMPMQIKMLESPIFAIFAKMFMNRRTISKMLESCFLDLTNITNEMIVGYAEPFETGDAKHATLAMVRSLDENEALDFLSKVKCPVLLLTSSDDKWRTPSDITPYFEALGDAVSQVVRNAGHLMHEEKPDKTCAAIIEYLAPKELDADDFDSDL